jgi:hypothetical protein
VENVCQLLKEERDPICCESEPKNFEAWGLRQRIEQLRDAMNIKVLHQLTERQHASNMRISAPPSKKWAASYQALAKPV